MTKVKNFLKSQKGGLSPVQLAIIVIGVMVVAAIGNYLTSQSDSLTAKVIDGLFDWINTTFGTSF